MRKPAPLPLRYRLGVLSRCLAASLGGYALTSAASALLAGVLPTAPAQAAVSAMMLGFVVYVLAVLWAFACRSALKAWMGIGLSTLALALGDLALYRMAAA
ncbi:DUF3649 domain-containing protein [Pseudomonas sp. RIT-PI-S]|uniref:DUF3649 domain-containing protein n=1 Tax=Pseudomonas sp. RIT-PI-S TaxID=3035295 RepID=UPI0021D973F6|nr:DUF3649 domain-containing protein [Pseudomonas sp. RIT-PI-S]